MEKKIALNSIQTPDGTILISHHRHDYKKYQDQNGRIYIVDGGRDYLKRGFETEDFIEKSIFYDEQTDFQILREAFHWGNRGKNGDMELKYLPISEMSNSHIQAILENYSNSISGEYKELFEKEISFRKDQNISIED